MVWTAPKTWTVGEVLTSTDMNTYVRDNTLHLYENTVVRLESQSLSSDQPDIVFSSLPSGTSYRSLLILGHARATLSADFTGLTMQFNGDGGSNYYGQEVRNINGAVDGLTRLAAPSFRVGLILGATASPTTSFSPVEIRVFDHGVTSRQATMRSGAGGSAGGSQIQDSTTFGRWNNTAAVSSIRLSPSGSGNFRAGTVLTLYGVR